MKNAKKMLAALSAVVLAFAAVGCTYENSENKTGSSHTQEKKEKPASAVSADKNASDFSDEDIEKALKNVLKALEDGEADAEKIRAACYSSEEGFKEQADDEYAQLSKANPDFEVIYGSDVLSSEADGMVNSMLLSAQAYNKELEALGGKYAVKDLKTVMNINVTDELSGKTANFKNLSFTLKGKNIIYTGTFTFVSTGGEYLAVLTHIEEDNEQMENLGGSYSGTVDLKTANKKAKTAFNSVAEYFADRYTEGKDEADVLKKGDFEIMNSKEGLDLSKVPDNAGEGDKLIVETFKFDDSDEGIVYLGTYEPEKGSWNDYDGVCYFVQYKDSADSKVIGQYPDEIETNDRDKVVWGEHFDK